MNYLSNDSARFQRGSCREKSSTGIHFERHFVIYRQDRDLLSLNLIVNSKFKVFGVAAIESNR